MLFSPIFVSAGILAPKKGNLPFHKLNNYLNYGLVSLASVVKAQGFNPIVYHGGFDSPASTVNKVLLSFDKAGDLPLFLSIPSSFAITWAKLFCQELRQRSSDTRIIVGGRWVIAGDTEWIYKQIPEADLVVDGLAEDSIINLLHHQRTSYIQKSVFPAEISQLDYSVLDDRSRYHPSIEVSRGCGRGCSFCPESAIRISSLKDPHLLVAEILSARKAMCHPNQAFYFESSNLVPTERWTAELLNELGVHSVSLKWRCEMRMDGNYLSLLPSLHKSGLRVIDLGLESGSTKQLQRMRKTPNPDKYLASASNLLMKCSECGIWPKVNIMLYPGETDGTVSETIAWLESHRQFIKGISAGSFILYRPAFYNSAFMDSINALGASASEPDRIEEEGYSRMILSEAIDADRADQLALCISRMFMSSRDYFDLKSCGYYAPHTSFEQFEAAYQGISTDLLPFSP